MAHNTDHIPEMFSAAYTGAPEPVFFSMWEDDLSLYEAMDDYTSKWVGIIPGGGDDEPSDVDDDSILEDPDALEKVIYQSGVSNPGAETPYGWPVDQWLLDILRNENPGLDAYVGMGIVDPEEWNAIEDWGDWVEEAFGEEIDATIDAIETEGDVTGDKDGFWDKVLDVGRGVAATAAPTLFIPGTSGAAITADAITYSLADATDYFQDLIAGALDVGENIVSTAVDVGKGLRDTARNVIEDYGVDTAISKTALSALLGVDEQSNEIIDLQDELLEERADEGIRLALNAALEGETSAEAVAAFAVESDFSMDDIMSWVIHPDTREKIGDAGLNVAEVQAAVSEAVYEVRARVEALLDADPLAVEKAVYQGGLEASGAPMTGAMTPYGPALGPDEVDVILDVYSPDDDVPPDGDVPDVVRRTPGEPTVKEKEEEAKKKAEARLAGVLGLVNEGYARAVAEYIYDNPGSEFGNWLTDNALPEPWELPRSIPETMSELEDRYNLSLSPAARVKRHDSVLGLVGKGYSPAVAEYIVDNQWRASWDPEFGDWLMTIAPTKEHSQKTMAELFALYSKKPNLLAEVFAGPVPDKVPSYSEQFSRIFDNLSGSQQYQAQQRKGAMFTDAETLFYLMTDWSERDWMQANVSGVGLPTLALSKAERVEEEKKFGRWLNDSYLADPRETRFGSNFYNEVRDLRSSMLELEDLSQTELYKTLIEEGKSTGEAQQAVMQRFVFMDVDEYGLAPKRLAKLVGMYNIHPGADNWLKAKMTNFYGNMMGNWLASGRTPYDFLRAFVKDKPAMDVGGGFKAHQATGAIGLWGDPGMDLEMPGEKDIWGL